MKNGGYLYKGLGEGIEEKLLVLWCVVMVFCDWWDVVKDREEGTMEDSLKDLTHLRFEKVVHNFFI